ncbi:MAG TPA: chemotaxis protein CheD [Planctomycetota bacterium]|jgi:chemotaxis protein CheD
MDAAINGPAGRLPSTVPVGIGELYVSREPGDVLAAYALGSCVAVILYDPNIRAGGMAHIQLPDRRGARPRGNGEPAWAYAEDGVPELISRLYLLGAVRQRLRVSLVGGALVADPNRYFQIGRKNVLAVKRILWEHGLIPSQQVVGGESWRTVRLHVGSGRITVVSPTGHEELIA